MTFKEWAIEYMVERGMLDTQAEAVFTQLEADEVNEPMRGRWNDQADGYPPVMRNILTLSINTAATEWIDANLPQAWYRTLFAGEV